MKRLAPAVAIISALALAACRTTAPRPHETGAAASSGGTLATFECPVKIPAREIIIVRHADRDKDNDTHAKHTGNSDYDSLTSEGWARVAALAAAVKGDGVTRIVATTTLRTQQTAYGVESDLAKAGHTPFLDFASLAHSSDAAAITRRLEAAQPNDVVLVICHHEYVPGIIHDLGGPIVADINDAEYDRLYTLKRSAADSSQWTLAEKSFGAPFAH
ncbi:MAG TPA: histidine phosphatase family protein [Phycisphaerae bacterium]|nr:histidine phosphatase family protein [Phycisphaerae bacterium]